MLSARNLQLNSQGLSCNLHLKSFLIQSGADNPNAHYSSWMIVHLPVFFIIKGEQKKPKKSMAIHSLFLWEQLLQAFYKFL